jgi:hypothetical protein
MPIAFSCPSCGSRLKVPDSLAGRKAKCSQCGGVVAVSAAAPPVVRPRPKTNPVRRPTPEEVEPEERPRREPEDRDEDEVPRKERRPKKKKKKRLAKRAERGSSIWPWWVGGLTGCLVVALVAILLAVRAGHAAEVIGYGLMLAVLLPISTVILIFSMIISSHLSGGIDFGEIHIVIPKAVALLLLVNLVSLVPFGVILVFPIWLFGLMYLFGLDLWETRFLVAINWLLNLLVKAFMLAALLSALQGGKPEKDELDQPPPTSAPGQPAGDLEVIEDLGGLVQQANDDDLDSPVVRITLTGRPITDAQLARLQGFPTLRVLELGSTQITDAGLAHLQGLTSLQALDLSRTRVTDAGLVHLKGLSQLQTLNLTGTKVTANGVKDLQKALPRLRITR